MKKRVLIAVAGAVMLAVLVGCGSKETTSTQTSSTTTAATTTTTEEETTEATTPEPTQPTRKIMPTATPTPVAGLKSSEVYEELSGPKQLVAKEEFDAEGYRIYHADYGSSDEPTSETSYEYEDGLCVSESGTMKTSWDDIMWDTEYTYDDGGRMLTSECHKIVVEDGYKMETICLTTYTYDEYGAILDEYQKTTVKMGDPWYKDLHTIYTYDDDGYLLSKEVYLIRSTGEEELQTRSEYTSADDGTILSESVYNMGRTSSEDPFYGQIDYEYDTQGRLSKTTEIQNLDEPDTISVVEYTYTDKGLISEIDCYSDGEMWLRTTYVYAF